MCGGVFVISGCVSGESQDLVASNKSEAQAKDCLPHVRCVLDVCLPMYVFLIKTYSHLDIEVVFAMPLTLQLESHHTSAVVMRLIVLQNQK